MFLIPFRTVFVLRGVLSVESTSIVDPYYLRVPFNDSIYNSTKPMTIGWFVFVGVCVSSNFRYDFDGWCETVPAVKRAVHHVKTLLENDGHTLGKHACICCLSIIQFII
jgi:hypothetical protein